MGREGKMIGCFVLFGVLLGVLIWCIDRVCRTSRAAPSGASLARLLRFAALAGGFLFARLRRGGGRVRGGLV